MSISKQIKALLALSGKKQADLIPVLGMANKQSLSNKILGERWSAADLIKIADFTGCKLAFVLQDGERVVLSASETVPEGCFGGSVGGGVTSPNTREE